MKKKIILLVICGIVLLGICGCGKEDNISTSENSNNDKNESNSENIGDRLTYLKTFRNEIEGNVILGGYQNSFFLDNGVIMECDYNQLYSNDTNCITRNSGMWIDVKDEYDIPPIEYETETIMYVKNNTLYISDEPMKNNVLSKDENIMAMYRGQYMYIKTNKAFYSLRKEITNSEECNKYKDIECEYYYRLIKDDFLTEHYNEIEYITGYVVRDIISGTNVVIRKNKLYFYND